MLIKLTKPAKTDRPAISPVPKIVKNWEMERSAVKTDMCYALGWKREEKGKTSNVLSVRLRQSSEFGPANQPRPVKYLKKKWLGR